MTTLGVPTAHLGTFEVAVLNGRTRSWTGAAWSRHGARAQLALEVASASGRRAMLAAAAWRAGRISLRGRFEHAAASALSPWSTASVTQRRSASRQGVLQGRLRLPSVHAAFAAAHAARRDSMGTRRQSWEHLASIEWSHGRYDVELRLRQRSLDERGVGLETFAVPDGSRTRAVVLRLRTALAPFTCVTLEYRAVETRRLSDARVDTGSAWVMRLDRRLGRLTLNGVASSFVAPSGRAAPYVPEPYVAGAFSSARVLGEGIRFASGISIVSRHVQFRARAASVFNRDGRTDTDVQTSLSLRLD